MAEIEKKKTDDKKTVDILLKEQREATEKRAKELKERGIESPLILNPNEPIKVVSKVSEAHNKAETVPGINVGKVGKFQPLKEKK